jgi:hypothetical protein
MQNTPGSQSSKNPKAQDQHSEFDHVQMGYTVQSSDGINIVVPNVVLKPDISKALKMLGGVCFHYSNPNLA